MYKVMFVDDDVPMLRYLQKMLDWEKNGCEIVAAAQSSMSALKQFDDAQPDLVITDIGLPQMDGLKLAAEFKSRKPDVRIVFLTCHEDFQFAKRAVGLKADDYLIKDELTPEKLMGSVERSIRLSRIMEDREDQLSYREELQRHKDTLKGAFLQELESGRATEMVLNTGRKLGIEWRQSDFLAGICWIDLASLNAHYRLEDADLLRYAWYNIAIEVLEKPGIAAVFPDEEAGVVLIGNFKRDLAFNRHEQLENAVLEWRNKTRDGE